MAESSVPARISTPISSWADDEKPREKLALHGASHLSNAELVGLLLGTGTRTQSAIDVARSLLQLTDNQLSLLGRLSLSDLQKVRGIGFAKAVTILAALELGRRRKRDDLKLKPVVRGSNTAFEVFLPYLSDLNHEEFWVLYLNRANRPIKVGKVSSGGLTATVVDPRVVFRTALECNATQLILAHNHPSGNLEPSQADRDLTDRFLQAGSLLEIEVLDHLIVSNANYHSFADHGML